jgi:hypothetical protein
MTESMGYLHEFETQRYERQDTIGIEIELPPTIDMVKQKRAATTTRSIKNRHRTPKQQPQPHETGKKTKKKSISFNINHLDETKIFCL